MKLNKISYFLSLMVIVVLSGCHEHKDEPQSNTVTNVTIIYAVNHNNLSADLINNRNQIIAASSEFEKTNDKVLLYSYENGACTLKELVYNSAGNASFDVIKNYEAGVMSTNPERINEVLSYVGSTYPLADKTLYLWGHGLGPVNPQKYSHLPAEGEWGSCVSVSPKTETLYSYGGEYIDNSTKMDYVDIDQLADAIPSGVFKTIWFDCCYMSSIEIAYQLRDKCRYLVAYPTEIASEGLPYNRVLPYTVGSNPKLNVAAEQLYDYYVNKKPSYPVTVTVWDLSKIGDFANSVKNYVSKLGSKPSFEGVVNYSRLTMPSPYRNVDHPYYDLLGWLKQGKDGNSDLTNAYKSVKSSYDAMVLYTKASESDFNYQEISPEGYFGISVYPYYNDNSERDAYYRKLDWWRDVASFAPFNNK